VDIAIRALSSAINDPTTAVQVLDQIEDLLIRLRQRHLEIGDYRDNQGDFEICGSIPRLGDLVRLSFDEICFCAASSVQVMRCVNALIGDLIPHVPEERRPTIRHCQTRVRATMPMS